MVESVFLKRGTGQRYTVNPVNPAAEFYNNYLYITHKLIV